MHSRTLKAKSSYSNSPLGRARDKANEKTERVRNTNRNGLYKTVLAGF